MKSRDYCKTVAAKYVDSAGLGVMFPLPGLTAVVTVVEAKMVQEIAAAYGESLTRVEAAEWIALAGAKNFGIKLASEALTFVPLFGWLARPMMTRWTTERLAETAIKNFEKRHPDMEYAGAGAATAA